LQKGGKNTNMTTSPRLKMIIYIFGDFRAIINSA
jgi:hypothetical protein